MDQYCGMCLCTDRNLTALTRRQLQEIIWINLDLAIIKPICWECEARLSNIITFRKQVLDAQNILKIVQQNSQIHLQTLSKLSHIHKRTFDKLFFDDFTSPSQINFEDQPQYNQIKIKQETDYILPESNVVADNHFKHFEVKIEQDIQKQNVPESPEEIVINKIDIDIPDNWQKDQRNSDNDIENSANDIENSDNDIENSVNDIKNSDTDFLTNKNGKYSMRKIVWDELQAYREKNKSCKKYLTCQYKCETCIIGYYSLDKYNRHKDAFHNPTREHECSVCESRFTDLAIMENHHKEHFYIFKCNVCDHETLKLDRMEYHCMNQHKKTYRCPQCSQEFSTNHARRYHVDMTHKATKNCDKCGKDIKIRNYKQHIETHNKKGIYECKICKKSFKSKISFKRHVRLHESSGKESGEASSRASEEAYCIECDKSFKTRSSYKEHLKVSLKHRDASAVRFECDHCKKSYSLRGTLERHVMSLHLPRVGYHCPVCDKRFVRTDRLSAHVAHVHEGAPKVKDKVCSYCGKAFSTTSLLKIHTRIHTGDKPFSCSHCGMCFTQNGTLLTHVRGVHLKIKK